MGSCNDYRPGPRAGLAGSILLLPALEHRFQFNVVVGICRFQFAEVRGLVRRDQTDPAAVPGWIQRLCSLCRISRLLVNVGDMGANELQRCGKIIRDCTSGDWLARTN